MKVNAYGAVDELGAFLGLVRFYSKEEDIRALILELQKTIDCRRFLGKRRKGTSDDES